MNRFVLPVELLEGRRLRAGVSITFDAAKTIVRIAGTSGNDAVDVSLLGKDQVRITDGVVTKHYPRSQVKHLTFDGGAGNDSITLGHVQVRAVLNGGAGNDSLSASTGNRDDMLFGGDGNDYLYGGPGDDRLDGGNGGDVELGGAGDDVLQVKSETDTDDTASGGDGTDIVSLSTYTTNTVTTIGHRNAGLQQTITDTVYGDIEHFIGSPKSDKVFDYSNRPILYEMGAGDDAVEAGTGNDTLYGGDGRDSLSGGGGDDDLIPGIAGYDHDVDSMVGGAGTDFVYTGPDDLAKQTEGVLTVNGDAATDFYSRNDRIVYSDNEGTDD